MARVGGVQPEVGFSQPPPVYVLPWVGHMKYYVLEPEVAGGLGENSIVDHSVVPFQVTRLHYEFEGWLYTQEAGGLYEKKLLQVEERSCTAFENFIDAIKGRAPNMADADAALDIQKILDGIYTSAREGREISLLPA